MSDQRSDGPRAPSPRDAEDATEGVDAVSTEPVATSANGEGGSEGIDADPSEPPRGNEGDHEKEAEIVEVRHEYGKLRRAAYSSLPILALILAVSAAFLKWQDSSVRDSHAVGMASVEAAKQSTVTMLSYRPDTVQQELEAASNLLTGGFKDSYSSLIHDVVIPGSRQSQISAVANVVAAAPVSATANHAVALVFVNQTITQGNEAPTDTASSVRVTMELDGGRWLISGFDPV